MIRKEAHGSVDSYALPGPLNRRDVGAVQKLVDDAIIAGRFRIVLNCERVSLVDSAGLETLLDIRDACVTRGGRMVLCNVNGLCEEIFRATGTADRLERYPDQTSAVGSFAA